LGIVGNVKRDHILSEIRRTAAENGGVPLGRQRFLVETGIKESDWLGKYWARWGDAVREAGFAPNQLQGAFDTTFLFENYIALTRELGRLPVNADLLLKAKVDPKFPNAKTFARLGSKADFVAQLLAYCRSRGGYDEVVSLCEAYAPIRRETPEDVAVTTAEIGFVYLLKSGRFYKIGRTNAAGRRERELAIQLPERATTVHIIRTDDPVGIEAYWHRRFEARHKNGEWFELSAADVAAFRRRKFM